MPHHTSVYKRPYVSKDFAEAITHADEVGRHVALHGRPDEVVSKDTPAARERRRLNSKRWRHYNRPGTPASKAFSQKVGQDQ